MKEGLDDIGGHHAEHAVLEDTELAATEVECRAACFTHGVAGRCWHGWGRRRQSRTDSPSPRGALPDFCPQLSRAVSPWGGKTSLPNALNLGRKLALAHVCEPQERVTHRGGLPPTRPGVDDRVDASCSVSFSSVVFPLFFFSCPGIDPEGISFEPVHRSRMRGSERSQTITPPLVDFLGLSPSPGLMWTSMFTSSSHARISHVTFATPVTYSALFSVFSLPCEDLTIFVHISFATHCASDLSVQRWCKIPELRRTSSLQQLWSSWGKISSVLTAALLTIFRLLVQSEPFRNVWQCLSCASSIWVFDLRSQCIADLCVRFPKSRGPWHRTIHAFFEDTCFSSTSDPVNVKSSPCTATFTSDTTWQKIVDGVLPLLNPSETNFRA